MTALPEYLIRNAYLMSMDRRIGDLANADVHVRDGRIAAVGVALAAPGAEEIDATDMIALPGFVETHWHIWTALLRSMAGDKAEDGYFPTSRTIGRYYEAADMYHAARLATAEALYSGITFVHDWCHNVRGPEFAEQNLRALAETGIRGRFSYGIATGQTNEHSIDIEHLCELHARWGEHSNGGLLSLGLAWRGVGSSASLRDHAAARELGLPVSVHVNATQRNAGAIAAIAGRGLLGPDVQLIHAIWSSPDEIASVAASGASLSLSPYTEMRIGFGLPMTGEYLAAGVPVGLSIDTTALCGNADMFALMKAVQNVQNARALDECALPARRVLELATIEGARSMRMDTKIGSIAPGKYADLILVDTRHVNLGIFSDPAHMLVGAAQPANVDSVFVGGRALKRRGRLVELDTGEIIDCARAAGLAARRRANWW